METIGRYKLASKIGAGGMAEVFLARSRGAQGTEKQLVIKKIHPALASNAKFIAMFVDEAHVAIRLNHTNIVQVYTFEHVEEAYILAMEFVDGTDLLRLEKGVIESGERFPAGLAAYVTAEVAKGLDYAHSRRDDYGEPLEIVHRDVSPQNILLSRDGAAKIADFGIARARWLHEDAPGAIKGKFGYMSPEQAQGLPVDRRTDIYSLGVVLYEMLIGRPLFQFEPGQDPRQVICDTRHPGPKAEVSEVPGALDEIARRAISHEPEERFDTARDMARALTQYLHSEEEIYDAQALETFIERFDTYLVQPPPEEETPAEASPESTADQGQGRAGGDVVAVGTVEQRSSIAVTGRLDIEPHPSRDDIHGQLTRLIGEMAFKSDAVLRQGDRSFSLYLGLLRSTTEDAISAVRLAFDVLDATRALSRDNRLSIRLQLSVCKGIVHSHGGAESSAMVFDPDPEFVDRCSALSATAQDGEIVADDQIFKLARRDYHFDAVNRAPFDALRVPVNGAANGPVHIISGMRSRLERSVKERDHSTFLGRDTELESLGQALLRAGQGTPQIYRLFGEVGIGKTRFIEEFLKRNLTGDAEVLTTECLFVERDTPMAAAAAALRTILGLQEMDLEQEIPERLTEIFAGAPAYRLRQEQFLKEFLTAPDSVWARNPVKRRTLVQRAAFGMGVLLSLRARARTVVLVVENAQWLDGPSIDVLSELAHERPQVRVIVLLVGQPSTLEGRKIAHLKEIEIPEMPDSAIRQIVLERLGTTDGMKIIAEQIIRRAHGNPFFANEIVDSLIEQKIVVKNRGNGPAPYRQARPGTIPLPATMEGIAASRIAALPPSQRTVLRASSAIGASFDEETVSVLVGRDASDEIAALNDEGVFVESHRERDGTPTYRFAQPMMREVAYAGLEAKDCKRIHRIIAKRLEAAEAEGMAIPNARIAWHLEGAGENEAAGSRYVAAGNAAAAIYSDREALKLFDRAVPLIRPNSHEKFQAMAFREQLLRYVGRFAEREKETAEMRRIAAILNDDELIAEALNRRAQLEHDLGNFGKAARLLTEALEVSRRSRNLTAQVEALRLLAFVAIQGGHLFRAVDCANRALAAIKASGEPAFFLQALALDVRGVALFQMGHLDDAARPLADALVLFRRLGKQRYESQVLDHLALLARSRGEMIEAIEFLERALRIDIRVRATRPRGLKLASMGAIHTDMGNFEGAYADLAEAERICVDNQERIGQTEVQMDLARLKIIEENFGTAARMLQGMRDSPAITRSRILLVKHHQLLALALLGGKRQEAARALADDAARIALEAGMNGEAIHGIAIQALILAEMGKLSDAVGATRRATDMLVMLRKVRNAELVWWYQALTFHKTGDTYLAKRALTEARNQMTRKRRRMKEATRQKRYENHPWIQNIIKGFK